MTDAKNNNNNTDNPHDEDWKVQLDANKSLGDAAFRAGDFATAIKHYSDALSLDPTHATLLSNRSAAYLKNGEKSKALYDAQACVAQKSMGIKGISRLAAALQSLGRYGAALDEWEKILKEDAAHVVALKGREDCQKVLAEQKSKQQEEDSITGEKPKSTAEGADEEDLLDDFFNDVEEATDVVKKEKERLAQPVATDAIKHHKKDLGTATSQIERLLADKFEWRNLNPFFVLDLPHTATAEDISRRYKALSLLLHPDKNQGLVKAEEAYDQVQKAKAKLDDENKANHARQLIEEGMRHGKEDWVKQKHCASAESLETLQSKAVQKIFAQAEFNRREVEKRTRNHEERERQQEEEEVQKAKREREFDKKWKDDNRVDKRIGNWRDFQKKKKTKL